MPLDVRRVQRAIQNQVHHYSSISSTMDVAVGLAEQGAPHGAIVVADEQTAGVGRLGRSWLSERDAGLYCSIILRLPLAPTVIPIATLLLGLATADAIQQTTNLVCDLRWPNDVLIGERKVAGILAQLTEGAVIAGIGVNVNQPTMPEGLRTPATSLRMESSGAPQNREDVLIALAHSIDSFCALLIEQGTPAIIRAFGAASSYVTGRRVRIEEDGRTGTTMGLDENGFLLVHFDGRSTERITSGGVRAEL